MYIFKKFYVMSDKICIIRHVKRYPYIESRTNVTHFIQKLLERGIYKSCEKETC